MAANQERILPLSTHSHPCMDGWMGKRQKGEKEEEEEGGMQEEGRKRFNLRSQRRISGHKICRLKPPWRARTCLVVVGREGRCFSGGKKI